MELKLRNTNSVLNQKFHAVILGESGVGKTYVARTLPNHDKVLFVNIAPYESGTLSISDLNMDVYDIHTIEDAYQLLEFLKQDEKYETVFVDGLTALSKVSIGHWEIVHEDNKNAYKKFEDHANFLTQFLLTLKTINKHAILTCLPSITQSPEGIEMYSFDLDGKSFARNLEARVDAVLALGIDSDGVRLFLCEANSKWVAKVRRPLGVHINKMEPADLGALMTKLGFLKSSNLKDKKK